MQTEYIDIARRVTAKFNIKLNYVALRGIARERPKATNGMKVFTNMSMEWKMKKAKNKKLQNWLEVNRFQGR